MNLKGTVKNAATRFGVEISRAGAHTGKHQQRRMLLDRLAVDLVLDVGANVGQYAGTHLRQWTGYAGRIASFEPVEWCFEQLAGAALGDPAWTAMPYGLSDIAGRRPINVPAGQEDLSSLHGFTMVGEKMIESTATTIQEVLVRRLDDEVDLIAKPGDRLALKIDVQGHEVAVLRGATETLTRVVLAEVEMPLVAMYKGQETFADLLATLADAGFYPVGMYSNYIAHETGQAMDVDVFFVNSGPATLAGGLLRA